MSAQFCEKLQISENSFNLPAGVFFFDWRKRENIRHIPKREIFLWYLYVRYGSNKQLKISTYARIKIHKTYVANPPSKQWRYTISNRKKYNVRMLFLSFKKNDACKMFESERFACQLSVGSTTRFLFDSSSFFLSILFANRPKKSSLLIHPTDLPIDSKNVSQTNYTRWFTIEMFHGRENRLSNPRPNLQTNVNRKKRKKSIRIF